MPAAFNEPAGISYAGGKLYVADTNAHRIRVVDLETKAVTTLELKGVEPAARAEGTRSRRSNLLPSRNRPVDDNGSAR